jgi:hypothetical protein
VRKAAVVASIVVLLVFGGVRASVAHHSHAMFDMTLEKAVTGTVTNFSYRNPHVYLYLDVKDDSGSVEKWAVEMSNIENMRSRGILQSTFRVGDVVTVKLNPLKNGRPGGNYTSVTAADGKIYQ